MTNAAPRPRFRALAAIAVGLALIAGTFWLKPFEAVEVIRETALRMHGVSRVRAGTLAAWEKNSCTPSAPCACVALIHGLGDSALTWDNILVGRKGAPPPPNNTRLLALELPGSEGSDPPSDYGIPAMTDAVAKTLQDRCPRWTVVGNSLGGWISATLAVRHPELVERLYLLNAAGLADPTGTLVNVARTLENPTVENMKTFVAKCYKRHEPIPDRAWPAIVASIRSRPAAKIVAALKEDFLLDKQVKNIKAPTTILWGADDGIVPVEIGKSYARLIPGARLTIVPDCGHLPQQECPKAVADALFGH